MTQQQRILIMLREAGDKGISSFGDARKVALQLPRVMNDLKKAGYHWIPKKYKDGHVDYILLSEPKKPEPPKPQQYVYIGDNAIPIENIKPIQESFI